MHHEINHPFLKHKLTALRDLKTEHKEFRELANEITMLICYDALKNIEIEDYQIETPMAPMTGKRMKNDIVVVPILRAGVGMLDGILTLVPNARVGFVGMYRDHDTKMPVEYYSKLPEDIKNPLVFIIDPMLATGGSVVATIDLLKKEGFNNIVLISIISAPEGIKAVEDAHPDVEIYTGNIDDYLDDNKYIIPGLGDAGDRLFGTK
ncbi:MAG TPA: uracil phosphoribosyltransferase [Spirochaetota bacterium]|nr:uracil phosphoribosyltransferase [Spirochaetota bacterium]HPJ35752.1 uracil phosphoribosyltransferase [Spirochaetota bacterium]